MKIYTRAGDAGETGIFGGQRVSKADLRLDALGAVDELNAHLGLAEVATRHLDAGHTFRCIQEDLLVAGADISTPAGTDPAVAAHSLAMDPARTNWLEEQIDQLESELTPLSRFLIPGGAPGAAGLHVCRTVCRRAERAVVRLNAAEHVNPAVLSYLNRLSDLLFVLARWVNAKEGVEEPAWDGRVSMETPR